MLSTLRTRFGIPGVISVIALVFAMFGGAYAASSSSGGGKATASAKAKKGPRGPKGATGPAGPAGLAGPQGPAGVKGDAGASGKEGPSGAPGAGVTSEQFGVGGKEGHCVGIGGSKFTSASGSTFACNGEEGIQGPEGEPWTAGGTLPPGKTETGTWAWGPVAPGLTEAKLALSIPIPMAVGTEAASHFITEEAAENTPIAECPGTHEEPKAAPGNFCMYESFPTGTFTSIGFIDPVSGEGGKFGRTGAIVTFFGVVEKKSGRGDWAVTAPEP